MRRIVIIAAVLAFCAVLAGTASSADAAPEAPAKVAHTQSVAQAHCDWHEVLHYGPNPNGVLFLGCKPIHLGGGHQAHATVCDVEFHVGHEVLMDINTGAWVPTVPVWSC